MQDPLGNTYTLPLIINIFLFDFKLCNTGLCVVSTWSSKEIIALHRGSRISFWQRRRLSWDKYYPVDFYVDQFLVKTTGLFMSGYGR